MPLQPHRVVRAHPETGVLTPLWTKRQVAEMAGYGRYGLLNLELAGAVPPSEYGELHGSPLWSLRQVVLVLGVVKWLQIWVRDGDKFAEAQLNARKAMCWKEWNDGLRKRLRNGNHRNARWRAQRLIRASRYGH